MSDMGDITDAVEAAGYTLERTGGAGSHLKVVGPDGKIVVDKFRNAPVTIPGTPGTQSTRTKMVAQLRRLGILDHDPFGNKPTQKRRRADRNRERLAPAEESSSWVARREQHDRLCDGMESFVTTRAGGWGQVTRIAQGAKVWMESEDLPGRPLTVEYAERQLELMHARKTLPYAEQGAWLALLAEINGDSDPLLRWIEIDRAGRGIPT